MSKYSYWNGPEHVNQNQPKHPRRKPTGREARERKKLVARIMEQQAAERQKELALEHAREARRPKQTVKHTPDYPVARASNWWW